MIHSAHITICQDLQYHLLFPPGVSLLVEWHKHGDCLKCCRKKILSRYPHTMTPFKSDISVIRTAFPTLALDAMQL